MDFTPLLFFLTSMPRSISRLGAGLRSQSKPKTPYRPCAIWRSSSTGRAIGPCCRLADPGPPIHGRSLRRRHPRPLLLPLRGQRAVYRKNALTGKSVSTILGYHHILRSTKPAEIEVATPISGFSHFLLLCGKSYAPHSSLSRNRINGVFAQSCKKQQDVVFLGPWACFGLCAQPNFS